MEVIECKTQNIVGVIQILHGMNEHKGRYKEFANFLAESGFIVVLSDYSFHGEAGYNNNNLGDMRESLDFFVEEQIAITEKIVDKYKDLPLYIIAHSMGTFIAQSHMKKAFKMCSGYVLIGSCGKRKIVKAGKYIFWLLSKIIREKSKIYPFLLFGTSNYDWLTRDKEVIEKYRNDKLCNFIYTPIFYYNLTSFVSKLYREKEFKNVNRDLPIYIIGGDKDIVGLKGRGIKKLFEFYKRLNFSDVDMKIYENCGHELLNELNKNEVYTDILYKLYEWLKIK